MAALISPDPLDVPGAHQLDVVGLRASGLGPIDLFLERGDCLVISGPSGSGKSRLLRAIADLDDHQGRVYSEGIEAQQLSPPDWRRRVGMLASESHWWCELATEHFPVLPTAEQLLALALDSSLLAEPVARLSSGERQRLALLRLLANHPRVLLLDEPTANLDPENVARVEAMVADYVRSRDAAALWVSHDPQQIARLATRHECLEAGRLVAAASP